MSTFKGRNIYFRLTGDECRIVRVIHASRDLGDQPFDEPADPDDTDSVLNP